jgi:enoyl-CoA hydratase/carnithine racemase
MCNYETVELRREGGVTEVRFHTDGGPMVWSATVHREAGDVFAEVAGDRDTKVVLITGTGDSFCDAIDYTSFAAGPAWEPIWWEGKRLLKSLLEIDVPVIGAINGPASIHAEIPLLADIVIAADTAVLADKAHFHNGALPADGVQLIWPWLLGPRRGKYFLMTNQELSPEEALRLGVVNEVVPPSLVSTRAWELATSLADKPLPFLRYTRDALNTFERQFLLNGLSHGLALEGLAFADMAGLRRQAKKNAGKP